jgi:hypothetical protein
MSHRSLQMSLSLHMSLSRRMSCHTLEQLYFEGVVLRLRVQVQVRRLLEHLPLRLLEELLLHRLVELLLRLLVD